MKKSVFLFTVLTSIVFFSCRPVPRQNLSSMTSVTWNGRTFPAEKGSSFYFYSEEFDISFEGLKSTDGIYMFAYHNSEFQDKYPLPAKCENTLMFRPGCAEADYPLNPEKGYSLRLNKNGYQYISEERRLNTENGALLPVRRISDPYGNFTRNLYLSLWVDFNHNNVIEQNEYSTMTIYFPDCGTDTALDFSESRRGYFTSFGFSFRKENFAYTGKEFKVYRITSAMDFEKVCQLENPNIQKTSLEQIHLHRFEDKNLKNQTTYMCFVPEGFSQVGNTFRLRGSQTIYLEAEDDRPENERIISFRYFDLPSDQSVPDVSFYHHGKVISVPVTAF